MWTSSPTGSPTTPESPRHGSFDIVSMTHPCRRSALIVRRDPLKHRHILAYRDCDVNLVLRSFARVVLAQPLAQAIRLHSHNRVRILIERILPVEDINRNRILLDLISFACEGFLAKVR